jgi:hypothetical protein
MFNRLLQHGVGVWSSSNEGVRMCTLLCSVSEIMMAMVPANPAVANRHLIRRLLGLASIVVRS